MLIAGKSTLLDVLANKKTGGKIEGEILINGVPRDDATFPRIAGYVEQSDSHYPTMTVREVSPMHSCAHIVLHESCVLEVQYLSMPIVIVMWFDGTDRRCFSARRYACLPP